MQLSAREALDRTALLINVDLFNGELDAETIIGGLLHTTAHVRVSPADASTPGGQHALVTLALHLAMNGIGIDVDAPDVPLVAPQPPLHGSLLVSSLETHITTTYPWVRLGATRRADVTFIIGTPVPNAPSDAIVVSASATRCRVGPVADVSPLRFDGGWPIGPVAAGIAGAAEAVRVAVHKLARTVGRSAPTALPPPGRSIVDLEIGPDPASTAELGQVVFVSAGAITQAALFVLQRTDAASGSGAVYDDDDGAVSNLNRYPLLTARDIGAPKVDTFATNAPDRFAIEAVPRRYQSGDAVHVDRMVIGADDIAIRWRAYDDRPRWLAIGATSHLFAEVSTHDPSSPCPGCVHDHEDEAPTIIPTISIVSGWAGLVTASALLRSSTTASSTGDQFWSFPLGLGGRFAHRSLRIEPNPRCPVRCDASSAKRATAWPEASRNKPIRMRRLIKRECPREGRRTSPPL